MAEELKKNAIKFSCNPLHHKNFYSDVLNEMNTSSATDTTATSEHSMDNTIVKVADEIWSELVAASGG